jgi:hypothetical protein
MLFPLFDFRDHAAVDAVGLPAGYMRFTGRARANAEAIPAVRHDRVGQSDPRIFARRRRAGK